MIEFFDPLKAFDEGAEHARVQRIATIAQLAHEWAKAYRAHHAARPTSKSAHALSTRSLRLERACLGPREKKGASDV